MKALTILILMMISTLAQADYREDIKALEEKFLATDFQKMEYKHQELPDDVKHWLMKVTYGSDKIANFGEAYNVIDRIEPGLSGFQHQYTLLTDEFAAIVINSGGLFVTKHLLLIDRTNHDFACSYRINWDIAFKEGLKYLFIRKKEAIDKHLLSGLCEKLENHPELDNKPTE